MPELAARFNMSVEQIQREIDFKNKITAIEQFLPGVSFQPLEEVIVNADIAYGALDDAGRKLNLDVASAKISANGYDHFEDKGIAFSTRIVKFNKTGGGTDYYFAGIFAEKQPYLDGHYLPLGIIVEEGKITSLASFYYEEGMVQSLEEVFFDVHLDDTADTPLHHTIVNEFLQGVTVNLSERLPRQ